MSAVPVDDAGIVNVIEGLKLSSSSGVDTITSKVLKHMEIHFSLILSILYQQSLDEGELPSDLK